MFTITALILWAITPVWGVEPHFSVSSPWTLDTKGPQEWTLKHTQHPAILHVSIQSDELGLTLIHQNRTLHTALEHQTIPLLSPPFTAAELTKVRIETQGIDLVIRLEGPSIQEWTGLELAPLDPVLSWTRIRVRGTSWRFIMKGLQRFTLPASDQGPHPHPHAKGGFTFKHGFGTWHYQTDAAATIGEKTDAKWYIDTTPSVNLFKPYPHTVMEWTP